MGNLLRASFLLNGGTWVGSKLILFYLSLNVPHGLSSELSRLLTVLLTHSWVDFFKLLFFRISAIYQKLQLVDTQLSFFSGLLQIKIFPLAILEAPSIIIKM